MDHLAAMLAALALPVATALRSAPLKPPSGGMVCRAAAADVEVLSGAGAKAITRYVASTPDLDAYREIIRQEGWTNWPAFDSNPIVVDCHDYGSSRNVVGKVVRHAIQDGKLIEEVEWAVKESALAADLFAMVEGGFLRACSVGFKPIRLASRLSGDDADFQAAVAQLGLSAEVAAVVRTIYLEQVQKELSVCPLGANGSALAIAKAYAGGALTDEGLERVTDAAERALSPQISQSVTTKTGSAPAIPADDAEALVRRERGTWLRELQTLTNR